MSMRTNINIFEINNKKYYASPYKVKDMKSLLLQKNNKNKKNYMEVIARILTNYVKDENDKDIDWVNVSSAEVAYIFSKLKSISSTSDESSYIVKCTNCNFTEANLNFHHDKCDIENIAFNEKELFSLNEDFIVKMKNPTFVDIVTKNYLLDNFKEDLDERCKKFKKDILKESNLTSEDDEYFELDFSISEEIEVRKKIELDFQEISNTLAVCIDSIEKNKKLIDFKTLPIQEKIDFIEELSGKEYDFLKNILEKLPYPKLNYVVECPKCEHTENKYVAGFENFF